jgi:hypothetical protein
MLAAVARWIASSERRTSEPIRIAAGAIGSIASRSKPARTRLASGAACGPSRRATRVNSTAASRLDTRRGQRTSSRRSAAVSASTAISLTSAEESRYATVELLLATRRRVTRPRTALQIQSRRRRSPRPEAQRLDLKQVAIRRPNDQLGEPMLSQRLRQRRIRSHDRQYVVPALRHRARRPPGFQRRFRRHGHPQHGPLVSQLSLHTQGGLRPGPADQEVDREARPIVVAAGRIAQQRFHSVSIRATGVVTDITQKRPSTALECGRGSHRGAGI